jgi:hypothetical protein
MKATSPAITDFFHAASQHWARVGSVSGAYASVYKVAMLPRVAIPSPVLIPLGEVAGVVYWGRLRYQAANVAPIEFGDGSSPPVISMNIDELETGENSWLVLMAPFRHGGGNDQEPALRARIESTLGLLSASIGENIAYERLADFNIDLAKDQLTSASPFWRNPLALPAPDISAETLKGTSALAQAIATADDPVRDRMNLALRWYRQSLEADGIDGLIRCWIALEVLAMPATDIAPVCESLARSYSISPAEAKSEFLVGRLFGLRSKIVHFGRPVSIDFSVVRYLSAIFVDVLLELSGQEPSHRARVLLKNPEDNPEIHIANALAV